MPKYPTAAQVTTHQVEVAANGRILFRTEVLFDAHAVAAAAHLFVSSWPLAQVTVVTYAPGEASQRRTAAEFGAAYPC